MFDYTNRVKKVINDYAPKEAKRLGHDYLGSEHILLGLLKATDSVAVKILLNLNIDLTELRKEIERRAEQDAVTLLVDPVNKDRIQKLTEFAKEEARKMRHSYIGSEHILLALLRDTNSVAAGSLSAFSVNYQVIRNELNQTLGLQPNGPVNFRSQAGSQHKKEPSRMPMLDEYARNLTRLAQEKSIDPIIGRDHEIERVIQILSRKTKNNPVLIGEAGVGKTAIVEGLAQRILQKKVPESLFSRQVFSLDVAALIAGTKYRGEFEDRIKKIMKEIKSNSDVILFIDELHTIIGAGAAEGAVDAANILKPALARGEVQCIGATTLREYKKYIEKDSALERRFQSVQVDEPSIEDTIRILAGLRKSYEKHHGVSYSKEAIVAAVRLTNRYVNDRYLPDKAIDIIDEAGARARLKSAIIPENLKEHEKKVLKLMKEKTDMVRMQEYEKAARLRDDILTLEKELDVQMTRWRKDQKELKISIDDSDIAGIISDWTGIPVEQLHSDEQGRLLQMEEELAKRVIGQTKAIELVSRAVKRSRTGIKPASQPIGSFIFLGPTGVGKTELAKGLAEFMFGSEDALLRFDMSEYMEMHSVSKFIGSPPGYVGFEEGGQLTEAVRRKPYSILLFDEIEKAHAEIQNIMLQILDEGMLTDTMGNKVDFKETVIIMTSNIGARYLTKGGKVGFAEEAGKAESKREQVMEELNRHFSPEFVNRLDEVIIFESLTRENIRSIVDNLIEDINANIIQKELHIVLSAAAKDYLGEKGYNEKFGARPLKRLIRREIEDELATRLLEGKLKGATEIKIGLKKEELTFSQKAMNEEEVAALKKEYLVETDAIDTYWNDFEDEAEFSAEETTEQPELAPT